MLIYHLADHQKWLWKKSRQYGTPRVRLIHDYGLSGFHLVVLPSKKMAMRLMDLHKFRAPKRLVPRTYGVLVAIECDWRQHDHEFGFLIQRTNPMPDPDNTFIDRPLLATINQAHDEAIRVLRDAGWKYGSCPSGDPGDIPRHLFGVIHEHNADGAPVVRVVLRVWDGMIPPGQGGAP